MAIVPNQQFLIANSTDKKQIYSNVFTQHRHLGIFGSTHSGKSTLLKEVVTLALAAGLSVTGFEDWYPLSQISPLGELAQAEGSLLNVSNVAFNLFELPDLRHFCEVQQAARLEEYMNLLAFALETIALAPSNENRILGRALTAFFADPKIYQRYQAAMSEGFGSKAWLMMPTLVDFLPYCALEYLSLSGQDAQMCQFIHNNLIDCLNHPIGKAISTTSNIPLDNQFMILGFQNNHIQDTPALTISALLAVMRRLLSAPTSLLFSDGCYSLLSNSQTAIFIARLGITSTGVTQLMEETAKELLSRNAPPPEQY